jgi:hypothetical protein
VYALDVCGLHINMLCFSILVEKLISWTITLQKDENWTKAGLNWRRTVSTSSQHIFGILKKKRFQNSHAWANFMHKFLIYVHRFISWTVTKRREIETIAGLDCRQISASSQHIFRIVKKTLSKISCLSTFKRILNHTNTMHKIYFLNCPFKEDGNWNNSWIEMETDCLNFLLPCDDKTNLSSFYYRWVEAQKNRDRGTKEQRQRNKGTETEEQRSRDKVTRTEKLRIETEIQRNRDSDTKEQGQRNRGEGTKLQGQRNGE